MATGRSNKLVGQVGEFLVCAELGRRGMIATPFSACWTRAHKFGSRRGVRLELQVRCRSRRKHLPRPLSTHQRT